MTRNARQRTLTEQIRTATTVLRCDWDPIGRGEISDLPMDEYASYAPLLVGMIARDATDADIAEHLGKLETTTIGLASGRDLVRVARQLRAAISAISANAT